MSVEISGHTKPFAVLGHPIGHSLSPVMHNASLRSLGMDAIYLAFDVAPDRLIGVLGAMRDMGFGGVNLTVPLKEVAFRGLRDLDETARRMGAVNTVAYEEDGIVRGYNTDGDGFVRAVAEAFEMQLAGKRIFVLGTGGAGRAVAITCAAAGAAEVVMTDVDATRAERVVAEIGALGDTGCAVQSCRGDVSAWGDALREADLVVQATPVGMKPGEPSLVPASAFRAGQCALDLIYMYPDTPFTAAAREGGARAANGLGMLLHQGARAFTIWTGLDPDTGAMRQALEQAVYG
jgi:shikimate dehydrogenase